MKACYWLGVSSACACARRAAWAQGVPVPLAFSPYRTIAAAQALVDPRTTAVPQRRVGSAGVALPRLCLYCLVLLGLRL